MPHPRTAPHPARDSRKPRGRTRMRYAETRLHPQRGVNFVNIAGVLGHACDGRRSG